MPDLGFRVRRRWKGWSRRLREIRLIAKGALSTRHPIMAHIIPIRRCNLSCTYCNEYDDVSKPVPTDVMVSRIDRLAGLGTSILTLSGGEPLLHPDLDQIIAAMRSRGVLAGMITNGYLLTPDRVRRLNRAGLDHMQISIDNVMPDDVSKKSLKVLDKKLQILAEHAEFHVNINSVVGGGIHNPDDALVVGKRALELGFSATVGIIHDGDGQLRPLGDRERAVYHEMKAMENRHFARLNFFQDAIAQGKPNHWRCRAGARYMYICEDGLVHYCSQQRGYPAKPLDQYTREDIRREYLTEKPCAPYCTVSCVHYVSYFDFFRAPQTIRSEMPDEQKQPLVKIQSAK
ncbi:MAG TPA: radical SAM protein [Bryobacteraceae bacterium]|nr:radical SAM protein [Bryobacteraceae bacterium]